MSIFLPDDDRGGRIIEMDVIKPEITEVDEQRCRVKIEGLASGALPNNINDGALIEIIFYGNQLKLPRNIYNIKITIEED